MEEKLVCPPYTDGGGRGRQRLAPERSLDVRHEEGSRKSFAGDIRKAYSKVRIIDGYKVVCVPPHELRGYALSRDVIARNNGR